ncbi:polar amino acid transport system permease protein [Rhizobium sp. BK181]|uniref:amino acid ABC transporter permease n=1 Tax=Rhizobium sp. BK181 TaxID=2587072 RepID=UPI00161857DB|nr:amino acid ABC transporter permease [Rhizobium sp. BK181]MBB3317792.1 polar amino acid transport system permease protein [Rhizobium sp. BK181]
MSFLRSVRPSNLIILTALPFIVYLFASSSAYQRSLKAILGVENGSSAFVPGFLLMLLAFATGFAVPTVASAKGRKKQWPMMAAAVNVLAALAMIWTALVHPFVASVLANGVDPFKSELIVKGVTPRQLTETADMMLRGIESWLFPAYLLLSLVGIVLFFATRPAVGEEPGPLRRAGGWVLGIANGAGLVFILFFAHIAFASGVATTVRAAIAAYLLAALLGLAWVGLLQLRASTRTTSYFAGATVLLVLVAAWFLVQPRDAYVLAGTLDGKIGIVTNTPASLVSAVRFGQYEGGPETETPVRTFVGPKEALASIAKNEGVSGALLPATATPVELPVLWKTEALNDRDRATGITFVVFAIILGLLTFGGFLHHRHPLAVGSELVVDTIRGIPMLVIVLYVGLPLSGALKDATQGVLDPPNILRGIVAMALAYSAYLAEIFRSGINAVPVGQLEAAKSIGLNRWQTARLVILPQALRIVIPPLGNELIAILKDTSLLSILSIRDITQRMREFQSASFLPFAPYNSAAIFYIFLTLAAASLVNMVERRYDVKHR